MLGGTHVGGRVKGEVMAMLRKGDMKDLAELTLRRPAAVRFLLARLWDREPVVRERAAEAVGTAAAQHRELGLELLRRFTWALNDESATNGANVLPAMAAVAAALPDIAGPFVGPMVAALADPGLAAPARNALERIAASHPELVEPFSEEMEQALHDGDVSRVGGEGGERWEES